MEFYDAAALKSVINDYTGLSPLEFTSIVALMLVAYKIVCGMFVSEEDFKPKATKEEQLQLGDRVTEDELRAYDGSDPKKPILIAVRGQIYDVSTGKNFYGPGGSYRMFSGKDASRALALLSFKPDDINGDLEGLDESDLAVLDDWEMKFIDKYPRVGKLLYTEEKWRKIEESRLSQTVEAGEVEEQVQEESKKDL